MINRSTFPTRLLAAVIFLGLGASQTALAAPTAPVRPAGLLAHDIGGFVLGMTVREVAARAHGRLHSIGNSQYEATIGNVDYDFGFTPLGHVYRVGSTQVLGQFVPDQSFGRTLTAKLTAKYGPPQSNTLLPDPEGGQALWGFLEPYATHDSGKAVYRDTESLSAMLMDGTGFVELDLRLMDYRILRRDLALLNAEPEARAVRSMTF